MRIVLARPRNPLNIGAAARAMRNFGLLDLAVVDPYEPVWRETRSAVKAAPVVRRARRFASVAEAVADRQLVIGTTAGTGRSLDADALYLPELGERLKERFPAGRGKVAVLFGSEKSGLTKEELGLSHWVLTVPTDAKVPSLNLGQAVALVSYELSRVVPRTGVVPLASAPPPPMAARDVERIVETADDVMRGTGYLAAWQVGARKALIRRTLLRWQLREPDAFLLQGTLRWVLKRLEEARCPESRS